MLGNWIKVQIRKIIHEQIISNDIRLQGNGNVLILKQPLYFDKLKWFFFINQVESIIAFVYKQSLQIRGCCDG